MEREEVYEVHTTEEEEAFGKFLRTLAGRNTPLSIESLAPWFSRTPSEHFSHALSSSGIRAVRK